MVSQFESERARQKFPGDVYKRQEFGESEELVDELLTACLTIYWQFIDLKNYRPDIVNSYLEEVKNYLRITNLNNYLKDNEFIRRLKIRYWDKKRCV